MTTTLTAALHASHEALKEKMDQLLDVVAAEEFPIDTRVTWLSGIGQKIRLHGSVCAHLGDGFIEIACDEHKQLTISTRVERLELIRVVTKVG